MKTTLLIIFLFLVNLISAQTSLEEYNYLTKGYKIQIESGLDMKKGYSLLPNDEPFNVTYNATGVKRQTHFYTLFRDNESKAAACLVKWSKSNSNYEAYFCIPHINSSDEIWTKAWADFKLVTNAWEDSNRDYTWGLYKTISMLISK